MKREGRQHGMVRTHPILPSSWSPRPEPRYVNRFNWPPTAGLFTKVSPKPTNHSKFTGKCGRPKCGSCHVHPACKAKVKAKGTQKLRSSDRLISFRVVGLGSGPDLNKYSGCSATGMLDLLAYHDSIDQDHDDEVDHNYVSDDDVHEGSCNVRNSSPGADIVEVDDDYNGHNPDHDHHRYHDHVVDDDNDYNNDNDDDDDEENMSFCDVGYILEQVVEDGDQEGWCIVDEM